MKKINIARKVWILSIFLILIVILIAIIDYKVHFEYLANNSLYFYDCSGNLCVTEVKNDNHLLYSKYQCGYEECPIFKSELDDNKVLLENDDKTILFDYRLGNVISSDYDNYQILNSNFLIVTRNQMQGIIDIDNNQTVAVNYDQLGIIREDYLTGYNLNAIIAKKNEKYGVISIKDGTIIQEFVHEETELENLLQFLQEN